MTIFDWLKRIFRARSDPPVDQQPVLCWLHADENPFGVETLDCTPVTQEYVSTSGDPSIAESYARLRTSTGEEYRGIQPKEAVRIDCNLVYPHEDQEHQEGAVFKSEQMEDKWDIYHYDRRFFFVRSWTGQLVYVAELSFQQDRVGVFSILRQGAFEESEGHTIRVVDYLIKSHIYRIPAPHPLPADLDRDPQSLALYSLQMYGRRCQFGTFGETLNNGVVEKQLWDGKSPSQPGDHPS